MEHWHDACAGVVRPQRLLTLFGTVLVSSNYITALVPFKSLQLIGFFPLGQACVLLIQQFHDPFYPLLFEPLTLWGCNAEMPIIRCKSSRSNKRIRGDG
jgi:hypothetical protein